MQKHFVTFYSPGTFTSETTIRLIDSWNVPAALSMAKEITERYNAKLYGFEFTTRERGDSDLDSQTVLTSVFYWLGGKVETLAEVKARATEKDRILVANMEGNQWGRIITNTNSWSWTGILKDTDIVLDWVQ